MTTSEAKQLFSASFAKDAVYKTGLRSFMEILPCLTFRLIMVEWTWSSSTGVTNTIWFDLIQLRRCV